MGRRSGGDGLESMFWIEGCLAFEHGASDGEQTVGNTAQGAALAMTALAQFGVAGAAAGVVLDGDAGPMVYGGAQPQMTGRRMRTTQRLPLRRVTGATPDRVRSA